jgi:hypothetical protein
MSLILEALRKLDREKQAPERGFLVVGAVPWPAPRARRWWPALAAVVVILAAVAASAFWFSRSPAAPPEAPRADVAPAIVPAVVPTTLAAPVAAAATAPPVSIARSSPNVPPPPTEQTSRLPHTAPAPALPVKPSAAPRPDEGLRLEAIGERDGKPVAIISGRLVREGDRYDGITIVRIGADEVEIEVQGQRRTLRF